MQNGVKSPVSSQMSARPGNATAENESAIGRINKSMPRRFGSKSARQTAVLIQNDADPRNGSSHINGCCFRPGFSLAFGLIKQDGRIKFALGLRCQQFELPQTCSSAGTHRMSKHHQLRFVRRWIEQLVARPYLWCPTHRAGLSFIKHQGMQTITDGHGPTDDQDNNELSPHHVKIRLETQICKQRSGHRVMPQ